MARATFSKETVMPFGKHKGKKIIDVPSDYLLWMIEHLDAGWLVDAADKEFDRRTNDDLHWTTDLGACTYDESTGKFRDLNIFDGFMRRR